VLSLSEQVSFGELAGRRIGRIEKRRRKWRENGATNLADCWPLIRSRAKSGRILQRSKREREAASNQKTEISVLRARILIVVVRKGGSVQMEAHTVSGLGPSLSIGELSNNNNCRRQAGATEMDRQVARTEGKKRACFSSYKL